MSTKGSCGPCRVCDRRGESASSWQVWRVECLIVFCRFVAYLPWFINLRSTNGQQMSFAD